MPAEPAYVPAMPAPPAAPAPITAEQLLRMHTPGKHVELIRGRLVVKEPPGYLHGDVTARLAKVLMDYCADHQAGRILVGDPGFRIATDPDTVRGPDIAFIARERVPEPRPVGYPSFAPTLVVEVLSPDDRPGEILAKVGDWLDAGTRRIWVVDPERRLARVYRHDGTESVLKETESLVGEDVLPGFACTIGSILS